MLEWLKTILGTAYTEDVDTKVSAEIGKGFVAKADFNAKNGELATANATIKTRDEQLKTLQEATGDVTTLQQTITTLRADNAAKETAHAAELTKIKLDTAVTAALTAAKAKNSTAAKALLGEFLAKAELAEDGTVKGLGDEIKKLTDNADTAFLFDVKSKPGMAGAKPAGEAGSGAPGAGGTPGIDHPTTLADAIRASLEGNES